MNIYQDVYNIITTYLFGGSVPVGSNQELITIALSSIATIFVFALPFVVVLKLIKLIMGD